MRNTLGGGKIGLLRVENYSKKGKNVPVLKNKTR